MFQFKKNSANEVQTFEDVTDEQLSQVTGGDLLSTISAGNSSTLLGSLTGTLTGTVSQVLNITGVEGNSVGGIGINPNVSGVTLNTPANTQGGLL